MKRFKGPELNMPDLNVPPFLADIYYDLRERRLLPLLALVVVAIAAVPFLLGGSEEPLPADVAVENPAEATELEMADPSSLTVVEAKPGLRDYRKRLRGRTPTDPFEQRYTGLPRAAQLRSVGIQASPVGGESSGAAVTETETPVTAPEDADAPPSSPGNSGNGGGSGGKPDEPRYFGFRPDVRFGVAGSGDLGMRDELPLGTFLPRRNPVIVFLGVTQNGKRALFDVSPEVSSVRGDGNCVGGKQNCRILSLQAGQAVTLLSESANRAFRAAVIRIDFVELDIPQKSRSSTRIEPKAAGLSQHFSN